MLKAIILTTYANDNSPFAATFLTSKVNDNAKGINVNDSVSYDDVNDSIILNNG